MSDTKKLAVSICLLVLLVGSVGATDGNAMSVEAGLLFVGNAEPDSAPSPVVQALGLSVTVYEGTFALVTTGVHVFGTLNQLVEAVPLPVELEVPGQTWIWVLNGVIELLGGFKVTLGDLAQVGDGDPQPFLADQAKAGHPGQLIGLGPGFQLFQDLFGRWHVWPPRSDRWSRGRIASDVIRTA